MTNKKYKYVFIDFDDTIVRTLTGNTFPKGVWDMQIQFRLLDAISKVKPEYIFIVSNQGGIPTYVTEEQICVDFISGMYHQVISKHRIVKHSKQLIDLIEARRFCKWK